MNSIIVYFDEFSPDVKHTYPDAVEWEVVRGVLTILDKDGNPLVTFNSGEWSRAEFSNIKVEVDSGEAQDA